MAWQWDTYDTYRLNKADLEEYLTELFGSYDFYIQVSLTVSVLH
jgi:hypothetical protein